MGSGRTGSLLACMLTERGCDVTVIDWDDVAFARLPNSFGGRTVLGNAVDLDVLRESGIEQADVFVAGTSGDNRNIMASQIAQQVFRVPKVICRVRDPIRAEIYSQLGIQIDCRTIEGADAILEMLGEPAAS
jgi:trk system potassium uptake protein TrkA